MFLSSTSKVSGGRMEIPSRRVIRRNGTFKNPDPRDENYVSGQGLHQKRKGSGELDLELSVTMNDEQKNQSELEERIDRCKMAMRRDFHGNRRLERKNGS